MQGLSAQNNIFIDGEYAYYFRGGIGLFRYSLTDKKEDLLLSYESTMDIDTMGLLKVTVESQGNTSHRVEDEYQFFYSLDYMRYYLCRNICSWSLYLGM